MTRIVPTTGPRHRQPRKVDKDHKGYIASLSCAVCGTRPVEVAHVRFADALYLKDNPGASAKPDDLWCLPLCPEHHRLGRHAQHQQNERAFWMVFLNETARPGPAFSRDPHALCLVLKYRCSPDVAAGERVLEQWRSV